MCELLGLAFNEPVTVGISFRGFRHRGASNPDGWGLAYFRDGRPIIWKEPVQVDKSSAAEKVEGESISSQIFIGHVRRASRGDRTKANTHPFRHDFQGTPVVFAHNGTLDGLPQPTHFRPIGDTDSEQAFCVLLSRMQEEGVSFSDFGRIERLLQELNDYGTVNVLFSNGAELFAYRDKGGYKGLCLMHREAPFHAITLQDEDWTVDLSKVKKPSERGFVIATCPLTDEKWTDLKKGKLLAIHAGRAVYGDPRV
jgi:glutamine amidotransferase